MKKLISVIMLVAIGIAYGATRIEPITDETGSVVRTKINRSFDESHETYLLSESNKVAITATREDILEVITTARQSSLSMSDLSDVMAANHQAIVTMNAVNTQGALTLEQAEETLISTNDTAIIRASVLSISTNMIELTEANIEILRAAKNNTVKAYVDLRFEYLPELGGLPMGSFTNQVQ